MNPVVLVLAASLASPALAQRSSGAVFSVSAPTRAPKKGSPEEIVLHVKHVKTSRLGARVYRIPIDVKKGDTARQKASKIAAAINRFRTPEGSAIADARSHGFLVTMIARESVIAIVKRVAIRNRSGERRVSARPVQSEARRPESEPRRIPRGQLVEIALEGKAWGRSPDGRSGVFHLETSKTSHDYSTRPPKGLEWLAPAGLVKHSTSSGARSRISGAPAS